MSPQVRKIVTYVVTGLLALLMVAAGAGKFLATEGSNDVPNYFKVFSDASWVPMLIGALELIAGLAIAFVPKLRIPAALGVMLLMLPALYAHFQLDADFSNAGGAIMAFVLSGLSVYLWKYFFLTNPPDHIKNR